MMRPTDTIAAIATAPGPAGIAVVRISGSDALGIADRIFRCRGAPPSQRPGNTFVYGHVVDVARAGPSDGTQQVVDEVVLLIFRAPRSYTREDVVEIQGHGGRICAQRILRAAIAAGARLAEPGEFTQRAFINGRIDLVQAEAVLDLIQASTERSAAAALEQLSGRLTSLFTSIYTDILSIATDIECCLDFPEEDVPMDVLGTVPCRLQSVRNAIVQLLGTWEEGHLLREGALVVIAGRPNAGKSTLLNALLGRNRAIVSETPGTTRDTIEEQIVLDGIPIRLVDTAGLRHVSCEVEAEGVRRAREISGRADVVLYVVDGSAAFCDDDIANLEGLNPDRCLVLVNKADLGLKVDLNNLSKFRVLTCSLKYREGLSEIVDAIKCILNIAPSTTPPHASISERHRSLLMSALEGLEEIVGIVQSKGADLAVVASSVRMAAEYIAQIIGKSFNDDIITSLFSKFCIGK